MMRGLSNPIENFNRWAKGVEHFNFEIAVSLVFAALAVVSHPYLRGASVCPQ
jgi:hypothetical protein